ncbi:MAG TPA: response regulator [Candidatus Saccharimonadia bacterium]|nr:response regulator [Candidatus Saccharimonadia bacterium]
MNNPLVLLADDDLLLHRVLAFKAAQQNWRLVSAYDGAECLRLAISERPALIILDGMMPVLDGFATLRELRRYPETSSIPVLMLSARNREADVVGALDEGANDYLTKPFSPAELLARVSRILAGGVAA